MGFNSVYQTLKELFPQVDARILKAVAIEHSKDPNGAVDSILTEVLPHIADQTNVLSPSVKDKGKMVEITSPSTSKPASTEGKDANVSDMLNDEPKMNSLCMSEALDDSLTSSFYDAKDSDDQLNGSTKNDDFISFRRCEETATDDNLGKKLDVSSTGECIPFGNHVGEALVASHELQETRVYVNKMGDAVFFTEKVINDVTDLSSSTGLTGHSDSCNGYPPYDFNLTLNLDDHEEKEILNCSSTESRISTERASISVKDHILGVLGNDGMPLPDGGKQDSSSPRDADFIQDSPVADAVGANDETALSTIVTRSGQICRINLLQDIIEDAKNHKDAMFSAMESVITLIKEVELREKEAQDTKVVATRGGLDILEKVEELKRMLKHAKEANDMHAGEVYGEKSILATEVRELQTRLLGLSDEKDKSLSILDEMREVLEARLIVSEEERRVAEQELLEKQELARGALAEQELIMEKVVYESKVLQQEAEENAKLRDFLMEKGRLVDVLQGEISVICQDVNLLKVNFDNHISLGKSLSFSQTNCDLASSTSSVKSMGSDPALGQIVESPSQMNQATSAECQTPSIHVDVEDVKATAAGRKDMLDEDWELFDF